MPFRVVAMDCGASRLALAAFSARPDGSLFLEDAAFFQQTEGGGMGTPWIRGVVSALQSPGIARRFAGPLFISPPSHETLVKFLKVPQVEPEKRAKLIQFEAQQNIPYPLNEVVWSSEPVFDDMHEFEIALVAAKRELMEELCGSVRRTGAMPARIEPSSLALHRAFRHNYPEVGGSILLVDIGARMTELVFTNPSRFFVRSVAVGGNTFTQALADELGQSFEEAEATKIRILSGQVEPTPGSPVAPAFGKAAAALANRLSLEITRSMVAVRRHTEGEVPSSVFLTGGGSRIGSLQPLLAGKLRMQVEWFDPFRRVSAANPSVAKTHSHQMCGLIGLAAGALDKDRACIDLLPPQVRKAAEFRRRQPVMLATGVLGVAVLAMPAIHYKTRTVALRAEVDAIDSLLAQPRSIQSRNRENLRLIEEAKEQAGAIGALVGSRSNWINFLSDLQRRLSKVGDVWIDRLQVIRLTQDGAARTDAGLFGAPTAPDNEVDPNAKVPLKLFVVGRLVDRKNPISMVSEESTGRVRRLMSSLDDSPFIASVDNERYDTTQPGILRFEFTMAVDPERPL